MDPSGAVWDPKGCSPQPHVTVQVSSDFIPSGICGKQTDTGTEFPEIRQFRESKLRLLRTEICALLGCYAVLIGSYRIFGTTSLSRLQWSGRLCRNVCNLLSINAAYHPRISKSVPLSVPLHQSCFIPDTVQWADFRMSLNDTTTPPTILCVFVLLTIVTGLYLPKPYHHFCNEHIMSSLCGTKCFN